APMASNSELRSPWARLARALLTTPDMVQLRLDEVLRRDDEDELFEERDRDDEDPFERDRADEPPDRDDEPPDRDDEPERFEPPDPLDRDELERDVAAERL